MNWNQLRYVLTIAEEKSITRAAQRLYLTQPSLSLSLKALDDLRGQVLNDMKGEELSEELTAYGASLEHNLNSSAMNRMPASKIVNSSTN